MGAYTLCARWLIPLFFALSCIFTCITYCVIHLIKIDSFEASGNQFYDLYPFVLTSTVTNIAQGTLPPVNGSSTITSSCITEVLGITSTKQGVTQWLQVALPTTAPCSIYNTFRAFLIITLFFAFVNLIQLIVFCLCKRCTLCGFISIPVTLVNLGCQWITALMFLQSNLGQGRTPGLQCLQSDAGDWCSNGGATPYILPHTSLAILMASAIVHSLVCLVGAIVLMPRMTQPKCLKNCCRGRCGTKFFECCCHGEDGNPDEGCECPSCTIVSCCPCCYGRDGALSDANGANSSKIYFRVPNSGAPAGSHGPTPRISAVQSRAQSPKPYFGSRSGINAGPSGHVTPQPVSVSPSPSSRNHAPEFIQQHQQLSHQQQQQQALLHYQYNNGGNAAHLHYNQQLPSQPASPVLGAMQVPAQLLSPAELAARAARLQQQQQLQAQQQQQQYQQQQYINQDRHAPPLPPHPRSNRPSIGLRQNSSHLLQGNNTTYEPVISALPHDTGVIPQVFPQQPHQPPPALHRPATYGTVSPQPQNQYYSR